MIELRRSGRHLASFDYEKREHALADARAVAGTFRPGNVFAYERVGQTLVFVDLTNRYGWRDQI